MQQNRNSFGKYRLIAELGHGGMADVYLAVAQGPAGFNKLQVLKLLRANLADEGEFVRMFLDEARLAARLNHPNIVQTNEVGDDGGRHYLTMEYLDGQSLHRLLQRANKHSRMPLALHVRVLIDVLAGLHSAHELVDFDGTPLNVVHRDVSPHNVFVTYDGQVKVVDFGIAKAATGSNETATGVLKGKLTYMAPEQARASRSVDRRADVFAVGVMLWEAVTGRRMWGDYSEVQVLHLLTSGEIPSVRGGLAYPVSPTLLAIVDRALAYSPRDRFSSAAEMQAALEHYLAETGERASQRELASFISELFSDKRQEIRALIESRLRELRSNEPSFNSSIPRIDAARSSLAMPVSSSMSGVGPAPTGFDLSSGSLMVPSVPNVAGDGLDQPTTSAPLTRPSMVQPTPPSGGGKGLLVAVFGVVVVAAAVGGFFALHHATAVTDSTAAAPSASASATTANPNVAELRVHPTPDDARVYFDDAVLTNNAGRFAKDGMSHKVRVEAPGYSPRTETVTLDGDRTLDVSLEKLAAPGPSAIKPVRGGGPILGRDPTTLQPVKKPAGGGKPQLDDDDPWKK